MTAPTEHDREALVKRALSEAYRLGQDYWRQADSDSFKQHKLADGTQKKFRQLCDETIAALTAQGGERVGVIGHVSHDKSSITAAVLSMQGGEQTAETVSVPGEQRLAFQWRVQPWMFACFGQEIATDITERNYRFLEESLELVQSTGCKVGEAHQIVDYVFNRPVGDPDQEVGGVMVTLAALCLASGLDMHQCGEVELTRVWGAIERIRAKQASKPKLSLSPLPEGK